MSLQAPRPQMQTAPVVLKVDHSCRTRWDTCGCCWYHGSKLGLQMVCSACANLPTAEQVSVVNICVAIARFLALYCQSALPSNTAQPCIHWELWLLSARLLSATHHGLANMCQVQRLLPHARCYHAPQIASHQAIHLHLSCPWLLLNSLPSAMLTTECSSLKAPANMCRVQKLSKTSAHHSTHAGISTCNM